MNTIALVTRTSLKNLIKKPLNVLLVLIPLILGLLAYYFFGVKFYEYLMSEGRAYIDQYIQAGSAWGKVVYYILAAILTVILFFVINWTFVICISLIASPFNDALSARIEKQLVGEIPKSGVKGPWQFIKKVVFVIFNEAKKILFIVFFASIGLIMSYIPILVPIGLTISGLLFAIQFLDFSWSRNDWSFSECFSDVRRHFFYYIISGVAFLVLVTLPVVNVFVPSLATSFYTTLWVKLNKDKFLV
ncbi:MAG: EI24 domain-containing protein [Bacteriovoracaceae bacterium]|nr:EI24 domain-containing protein [Bacteriovoracaceae bacterium]